MRHKQVLSITQFHPQTLIDPVPNLMACEFGAYLERSKVRQVVYDTQHAYYYIYFHFKCTILLTQLHVPQFFNFWCLFLVPSPLYLMSKD